MPDLRPLFLFLTLSAPLSVALGQSLGDLRGELDRLQRWAQSTPTTGKIEPERQGQWQQLERFAAKVEKADLEQSRRTMVAEKAADNQPEDKQEDIVSSAMSAPSRRSDVVDLPSASDQVSLPPPLKRRRRSFTPSY